MRVCLVSSGLEEHNQRLQPWCYLFETAHRLVRSGHDVRLLSDGYPRFPREGDVMGLPVIRLASLQDWPWRGNREVIQTVATLQPDAVLWHLGLTSFLHLRTLTQISAPVTGIFTSPIYRLRVLLRLGFLRLVRGWELSAIHLLGSFVPGALVRRALRRGWIAQLVVECETTRAGLIQRGVPGDRIHVIRPGIAPAWFEMVLSPGEQVQMRNELGFSSEDFVVSYLGSPSPLRGLSSLLGAIAMAREEDPRIKLLVLSRQRDGELGAECRWLQQSMSKTGAERWAHVVTGFLSQERLIRTVGACDAVALPCELVPSDVPLSVLEAMALGVPLITTQVACLPELVPEGAGLCLLPGNPTALAEAILTLAACTKIRQRLGRMGRRQAIYWCTLGKSDHIWNALLDSAPCVRKE